AEKAGEAGIWTERGDGLPAAGTPLYRQACKMATGSGKTVVMAMIVAWHTLNKRRYPNDRRFSDAFLIVTLSRSVYDAAGKKTALADPVGNRTSCVYDALNRLVEQDDPLNAKTTFAYDAAGRRTSQTDRLARRRDFSYDNANRPTGETWRDAGGAVVNTLTFTLDAKG